MPEHHRHHIRRIGFLLFDELTALDLVGPMDAFATANTLHADATGQPAYELLTIGLRHGCVTAESGLAFRPHTTLSAGPPLDTLVIPGGVGLRRAGTSATTATWIRQQASAIRRIASVCTGIFGLASSGLLDGRTVTTHWRFATELSRRFPALRVRPDAIFVKDGRFYTSAGITAGIDLSLALIEEDLGHAAALRVARELVVYMKRAGGQEQYSEPLRHQAEATDRIGEIAAYVDAHLAGDLSIDTLASLAHLSGRQFSRRFKASFHLSPAAYIRSARLDRARQLLCANRCNLSQLAAAVGFTSQDAFRRAFEQRFGLTPISYRRQFAGRP